MIELLFVACLATSPDDCSERSLLFTNISPMVCMMGAQPELAKWVASHPKFRIQSWRCKAVSYADSEA